ncbi:MAG TPA: ATP-binding protein [Caulobacterales bacterium]|nr:ATP-binding protein [Caulobacterales bacterium]
MSASSEQTPPSWLPAADRLVTIAAAFLIACIAALAIGLFTLAQLQERSAREGGRARALRTETYALNIAAADAESSMRAYLLASDPRFAGEHERDIIAMHGHVQRLRELAGDDVELRTTIESIATLAARAEAATSEAVQAHGARRPAPSRAAPLAATAGPATEALRLQAAPLLDRIESRVDAIRARNAGARIMLYWLSAVLVLLSLAAAGVAVWAIRVERQSWRTALAIMVRANEETESARAKAAASDLAKTRFLAAASHDMRQPLHALTLYLSALQRRVEGEEAKSILAKAERATQSMVGMFNTLLDLARIQADVVTPELETFALQDVIERVLGEHPQASVSGPAPATALKAHSDPTLVERLLRNLVSNALRHGGGEAHIAVEARGARVFVTVSDNGPGIPAEEQARIFEEFVRLDGRAGAEGLGLGLAIVKRIVELLGATIELRSSPGEGSAFTVGLPLAGVGAAAPASAAPVAGVLNGAAILVMDDDPLALEAEVGALRDLGADVRGCAGEAEVQALLDTGFCPRLLMMDLRIEGAFVGVEIAERARARLKPQPRVLMVTGDTAPETLAQLRASGHAWLIKPVSRDDLAAAVLGARERART